MNIFIVRTEYTGDEGKRVKAYDHEEAAETYAENNDCEGDYEFMDENNRILVEVESEDGVVKKFRVYGENQPIYHAMEVM